MYLKNNYILVSIHRMVFGGVVFGNVNFVINH
jgi:hypothetical protein